MSNPKIPLEPDNYFHIYNHAVGYENLFREPRNYNLFIKKIQKWIIPFCELTAYCLMPNHFHLLLRIKEFQFLLDLWKEKIYKKMQLARPDLVINNQKFNNIDDTELRILRSTVVDKLINEQFSHCFNSYVQTYNKAYSRGGSLMKESFNRKKIESDEYLRTLICYIHNNPVHHGFADVPGEWMFSSYNLMIDGNSVFIQREFVLELFDGFDNFLFVHQKHLMK